MKVALTLLLMTLATFGAHAQEGTEQSILDIVTGRVTPDAARTTTGRVHEIDYAARTAEISGYNYDFGPAGVTLQITLLGGGRGAFELIEPGQTFEITYDERGDIRIVMELVQIAESEFEDH